MEKKRKVGIGICILLLVFGVFFSSAFYSAQIRTENVITFGNVRIKLLNHELNESNQEEAVQEQEETLRKGNVSRIVKIQNVCSEPVFVRVKVSLNIKQEGEKPDSADGYARLDGMSAEWVQSGQWFYYDKVLDPGMITENLMEELIFDIDKLTADYAGATVSLQVDAQAVQSKHNGTQVLQAQGWPQEVNR